MHASVIASDKNPEAKQNYGYRGNNSNKTKEYHKTSSVAVWETHGQIKLFTGSHDGKWRLWATAPAAGGNGATLTKEFEHFVGGPIDRGESILFRYVSTILLYFWAAMILISMTMVILTIS